VDGVPLTVVAVGKTTNTSTGSYGFLQNPGLIGPAQGQSPLFSIDPADIESITVLKDADATSIYGSRGALGVILITTKKGKPGKTHLNIHVDEGVNRVTKYWQLLNTPQYLEMRREAFQNDGIAPNVGNAPDLLLWDTTRYTDWQRALYGRSGKVINTQLSLSGGDVHTTYRIGASYTKSTEITTASGSDQQGSISFNLINHSLDQRFSVTLSVVYSFTQSDMITLPGSVTFAPDAPSIYDSAGNLNWAPWDAANGGTGSNPFGVLLQPYTAKTNFLNSNLGFKFQILRGLVFKTSLGYNSAQSNQTQLFPIASQDPGQQPVGTSQFGNNSNKNWIVEPQINYEIPVGPGKFNVLIGGSLQENTTDGIFINGTGYTSDALLRTISNAPSQSSKDNSGEYRYAAVFARINYNWSEKYLLNLNARRDGSSNYGPGNQFGNFASVGAAWIFTDENWFKKHLTFLSFGKLRGSYGTTGSDGGIPYGYLTRWSSNGQYNYNGIQPLIPTQQANPNYQWQINRKIEGGIDMGFFQDWVTARISWYRNRTSDQLLSYPTSLVTGFSNVLSNLPALVQNQGWEYTIGGKGVHTKYFSWAPSFNFSMNQNKFVSFPGLASSPYRNNGLIGQPLNGAYVLHYIGVDPQTGQYTYQDRMHTGVIIPYYVAPNGGDVYFKKTAPTLATGFGFNFDLKGFNLALFFSLKRQTGINALAQGSSPGQFGVQGGNQPIEVLARWQKPGDITNTGKFSTEGAADPNGYLPVSDLGYTDASYIRLQNLSLAYNLPSAYLKKSGMQSFQLFIHANNIFVITSYKGIDPETQNFGGLPPTRTVVGGISVNF
jgi:TonB-linked SusC/RagA family outer membrane protein